MNNTNNICIYHLLDDKNISFYVGKTNNINRRKKEHLCFLKNNKKGKSWPVYHKIRKLIKETSYELKMEIIEKDLNYEEANLLEIEYIKKYKEQGIILYNLTDGGEGTLNHKPVFTDEWRKKLSEAKSGDNFKGEKNSFYGKKHTEKTKKILSEQRKGKMIGKNNPFYGQKHTDETKNLLATNASERFKGVPKSEEHKKKIGDAHRERKHNLEQIEKNRLKSCKLYEVNILDKKISIKWERGCIILPKFLVETYKIKISTQSLYKIIKTNKPINNIFIKEII